MFKIAKKQTFRWPVKVMKPSAETAGELVAQTCILQFEQKPADEVRAELAAIDALPIDEQQLPENDFVFRRVLGWEGVATEDGDAPFSRGALIEAWNDVHFQRAARLAYNEAISGGARLGN